MRRITSRNYFLIPVLFVIVILACNLPAGPVPAQEGVNQPQAVPVDTVQAAIPTPQTVIATPEIIQPTAVSEITTNLPIVVMEGGSGYIFSTKEITKDDRDIWWNAIQFVPASGYRMISLGVADPSGVNSLTFSGVTPTTFEPVLGEVYGIEITRNNGKTYAIIRVIKLDSERRVTFDWIYPFGGAVTSNP
ncbi:MAG: hypothetical protein HY864_01425 [Chloroflexi bacterium]|nr:hypothetical protein [Chloroflexota bacterium]